MTINTALAEARAAFRGRMEHAASERVWQSFHGRIAVVLAGGGARGAYEAGVLLAFQDARMPTHIVAGASVGSINAASYAAHSDTLVGNAEALVESWLRLTPPTLGIQWNRYGWMLTGLIAATAAFANLTHHFLDSYRPTPIVHDPALTWSALALAGIAALLLSSRLPYLGYVVAGLVRGSPSKPDRRKTLLSLAANMLVWGLVITMLYSLRAHVFSTDSPHVHMDAPFVAAGALVVVVVLRLLLGSPLRTLLRRLLLLPLPPGLFTNDERERLLDQRIPADKLHASPMTVVFTVTDLENGTARFFSNRAAVQTPDDPGGTARPLTEELAGSDDLLRAILASSALPIAYEPVDLEGRLCMDGGVVSNHPIRPAIRLGADVLFVVRTDVEVAPASRIGNFIDVGLRALDILMEHNPRSDVKMVASMNELCERAAEALGVAREEVEIDLGRRRYRYLELFTIRPAVAREGKVLDFGGEPAASAILEGYQAACLQIERFLAYAPQARFGETKRRACFAAHV